VPEDIIDAFGALLGSLTAEAPSGELDLEEEVFDAARIRADADKKLVTRPADHAVRYEMDATGQAGRRAPRLGRGRPGP